MEVEAAVLIEGDGGAVGGEHVQVNRLHHLPGAGCRVQVPSAGCRCRVQVPGVAAGCQMPGAGAGAG